MLTTLFTWEPVVECSVAQDYLESQPCCSADYQLVNTEIISASHEAICMVMVIKLSKFINLYSIIMV